MTAVTAGTTTRPSFDESYNELTGLDDDAIRTHLGFDIEELYEGLADGTLSNRQWLETVQALEFVTLRHKPNTPDELAAQLIREMPRKELAEYLNAYMRATFPDLGEDPDPESPEGKDSSPSVTPPSTTPGSTETNEPETVATA